MKIETTSVRQPGNETLGTQDKVLYYLILMNDTGEKLVINVGQKTHDRVKEMKDAKPMEKGGKVANTK